jgi:alkylation response protein AidB-like acyl-CoA dehydrogenase
MSAPDPNAILDESPIHLQGKRLGAELGAAFSVADHGFFREISRWEPLRPVLGGDVGDPSVTSEALIGLGEGCANGGLLLAFGAHCFAVASCISKFAAEETSKSVLPRLQSGSIIGAFAATEVGAGSDVMALETRFAETANGYVLRGEKTYVTNAVHADLFLVFATKDTRLHSRGISSFLVERSSPGVAVAAIPVRGVAGSSLGKLTLTDATIDRAGLVGRLNGGAQVFRHALIHERILLSAFLVGSMKRALTRSSEYAKSHHQFGVPIAANQYVSGRIVEMLRRYATSKLLLQYATGRLQRGIASEADASLTKLQASEAAVECQLDAFRIHGAKSLESAGGNAGELLDVLSSLTYSGTSDLQKVILAASLGLPA